MTARFHLSAQLPGDPDDRLKVRAEAFAVALTHAVNDPAFRLEMVIGEAYGRYREVVAWLANELEKEKTEIQFYAKTAAAGWQPSAQEVRKALLADAVRESILSEAECQKNLTAGSTDC